MHLNNHIISPAKKILRKGDKKLDKEIVVLKKKCNAQLDKIIELEAAVKERESQISQMAEEITVLKDNKSILEPSHNDKVFNFIEAFKKVIEHAQMEHAFITYSNRSKYSECYLKIEKEKFENYVNDFTDMEIKTFLDYAACFSFLKSEGKKCVYTSDKIRIYYISRAVLETLGMSLDEERQIS